MLGGGAEDPGAQRESPWPLLPSGTAPGGGAKGEALAVGTQVTGTKVSWHFLPWPFPAVCARGHTRSPPPPVPILFPQLITPFTWP